MSRRVTKNPHAGMTGLRHAAYYTPGLPVYRDMQLEGSGHFIRANLVRGPADPEAALELIEKLMKGARW